MKKLILLFLLIPSLLFAQEWQEAKSNPYVLGAVTSAGGSDEFGYTTVGGTSIGYSAGNVYASALAAPTYSGTTTAISIYSTNSTATLDVKVGLYLDNAGTPGNFVASASFTDVGNWTPAEWHDFAFVTAVTAATNYWIAISANTTGLTFYYNTLAGTNRHYDIQTWDTWANPYTSDSSSGSKYSFKVKYNY